LSPLLAPAAAPLPAPAQRLSPSASDSILVLCCCFSALRASDWASPSWPFPPPQAPLFVTAQSLESFRPLLPRSFLEFLQLLGQGVPLLSASPLSFSLSPAAEPGPPSVPPDPTSFSAPLLSFLETAARRPSTSAFSFRPFSIPSCSFFRSVLRASTSLPWLARAHSPLPGGPPAG